MYEVHELYGMVWSGWLQELFGMIQIQTTMEIMYTPVIVNMGLLLPSGLMVGSKALSKIYG